MTAHSVLAPSSSARGDESAHGTYSMTRPCNRCGGTRRYTSNGKCIACVATDGAARHAARIARDGNGHVGLKDGYVRLNTLAHRILLYVHEAGPTLHAELVEVLRGEVGLSANLGRLVRHGFLHRAGHQAYKPGVRGGSLFSIEKPHWRLAQTVPTTPRSRQHRYRAGRALKVPSVFEFRGSMTL